MSGSPFTLGVEGAGEVAAVGPGVEAWRPGDRVAYITRPPAGSYAQYTVVPEGKLARVPPELDLELAAASMIQVDGFRWLEKGGREVSERTEISRVPYRTVANLAAARAPCCLPNMFVRASWEWET